MRQQPQVIIIYSDSREQRVFNFVELWDRFGVLTCVPWFNALVWQVSGVYIEF